MALGGLADDALGAIAKSARGFVSKPNELSGTEISGLIWELRNRARGMVTDAAIQTGRYTEDRAGNLLDMSGNPVNWNGPSGLARAELDTVDELYNRELRPRLDTQWGGTFDLEDYAEDIDLAEEAAVTFENLEKANVPRELTGKLWKAIGPTPKEYQASGVADLEYLGLSDLVYGFETANPAKRKIIKQLLEDPNQRNYLPETGNFELVRLIADEVADLPAEKQKQFLALPRYRQREYLIDEPESFIKDFVDKNLTDEELALLTGENGFLYEWNGTLQDALFAIRNL